MLNLSAGKRIEVKSEGFAARLLPDTLRNYVERALLCETSTGVVSPVYERLLDGPFDLGGLPRGHLRPLEALGVLLGSIGFGFRPKGNAAKWQLPLTLSTVHGDLNLGNIMVDEDPSGRDHRDYWLIDFEKTHLWGHLAYDFAKLECEIRSDVIARLLLDDALVCMDGFGGLPSERSRRARERAVALAYTMEVGLELHHDLSGIPAPLVTAYSWLKEIRELARQYGVSAEESRLSTFLYTMNTLRFPRLDGDPTACAASPFPKVLHYIAGGVMAPGVIDILGTISETGSGN